MSISNRKFLSLSLQLSLEACNLVRQYSLDKNMKKYQKGIDDHVTQADYLIQSMLIKGFKMHFPQLKIIGEETTEYEGNIDFDYSKLSTDFMPENIDIHKQNQVDDSCLWIDPIDCTKGFIEGNLQDVTVLIGMSTKGKPTVGMIGIPFKKVGNERIFQPEILFGSVTDKKAYKYKADKEYKQLKPRKALDETTVTTSNSRSNFIQENYIKYMNAKNVQAGGAGRKIALVIRGEADMMAYVGSATCKWDSCAGQAIVSAMGGKFTTPTGEQITYHPDQSSSNAQGIFCSLNHQIHAKSIAFMKGFKQQL